MGEESTDHRWKIFRGISSSNQLKAGKQMVRCWLYSRAQAANEIDPRGQGSAQLGGHRQYRLQHGSSQPPAPLWGPTLHGGRAARRVTTRCPTAQPCLPQGTSTNAPSHHRCRSMRLLPPASLPPAPPPPGCLLACSGSGRSALSLKGCSRVKDRQLKRSPTCRRRHDEGLGSGSAAGASAPAPVAGQQAAAMPSWPTCLLQMLRLALPAAADGSAVETKQMLQ